MYNHDQLSKQTHVGVILTFQEHISILTATYSYPTRLSKRKGIQETKSDIFLFVILLE